MNHTKESATVVVRVDGWSSGMDVHAAPCARLCAPFTTQTISARHDAVDPGRSQEVDDHDGVAQRNVPGLPHPLQNAVRSRSEARRYHRRVPDRPSLGRGGMASVYRATHQQDDTPVALKILHPGVARDAFQIDGFAFEVRAAASLDHPRITAIYDYGVTPASGRTLRHARRPSLAGDGTRRGRNAVPRAGDCAETCNARSPMYSTPSPMPMRTDWSIATSLAMCCSMPGPVDQNDGLRSRGVVERYRSSIRTRKRRHRHFRVHGARADPWAATELRAVDRPLCRGHHGLGLACGANPWHGGNARNLSSASPGRSSRLPSPTTMPASLPGWIEAMTVIDPRERFQRSRRSRRAPGPVHRLDGGADRSGKPRACRRAAGPRRRDTNARSRGHRELTGSWVESIEIDPLPLIHTRRGPFPIARTRPAFLGLANRPSSPHPPAWCGSGAVQSWTSAWRS